MIGSQRTDPGPGAIEAAERIRDGRLTSAELVAACLDRIERTDPALRGWAGLDRGSALDRACEMDALRRHGMPLGALHGVPVAIDERLGADGGSTGADRDALPMPDPARGAAPAVVERLLEAGAVVVGTLRTVEAYLGRAEPALQPWDERRTAGAPCGNAAVAVRTGQAPLAVTCEARGGVMISASYLGVFGFRPARGVVSRRGAATLSPAIDQVGMLGRTLEDVALLADVLAGYDAADSASWLRPRPRMREGAMATPPVEPVLLRLDMPYDERLSEAGRAGFEELCERLGATVARFPAPAWFGRLPAAHRIIVEHEAATWWRGRSERADASAAELADPAGLARPVDPVEHADSAEPAELVRRGLAHGEERYRAALATMEQAQGYFSELFHDYDAIIAPATAGEAPPSRSMDDDHVFCSIWALCGLPALCVPLLEGESEMPIGVQSVGSAVRDDRLLRTTRWMIERVAGDEERSSSGP